MTSSPGSPSVFGLYKGICTNNTDPENLGRIKAVVPTVFGNDSTETAWAWPVFSPGESAVPLPTQVVWMGFEGGDVNYPYWQGVLSPYPIYAEANSGEVLSTQIYAPTGAEPVTYTLPYNNMEALDMVNLTLAFVVPENGVVDVLFQGALEVNIYDFTSIPAISFNIFQHGTANSLGFNTQPLTWGPWQNDVYQAIWVGCVSRFHLTNLTSLVNAGETLQVDLAGGCSAGGSGVDTFTATLYAQGNTGVPLIGDGSPVMLQAIASV